MITTPFVSAHYPHLLGQLASPGPVAFEVGPLTFRWYGLLIMGALLLGITLAQRLAQRRGLDPEKIGDLAVWLVLGALPGARLYYVAFEWDRYADRPLDALAIWQGALPSTAQFWAVRSRRYCLLAATAFPFGNWPMWWLRRWCWDRPLGAGATF